MHLHFIRDYRLAEHLEVKEYFRSTMTEKSNELEHVTRVCIKNVPPNFSESKLRSHLLSNAQSQLTITDCKILRTEEGISRKIAFVGFKHPEVSKCFVDERRLFDFLLGFGIV